MFAGAHPAVIVTTVVSGVLLLALAAVILSEKAQTVAVTQALGTSFSQVIQAAVSPITGGSGSGTGG